MTVSTSLDGLAWSPARTIHTGRESSGLWAFPVAADRIAVAVGSRNLDLTFLAAGDAARFEPLPPTVRLPMDSAEARFFVRGAKVWLDP